MQSLFLKLLNMSISAGWLVLAVVIVRALFAKLPKWLRCALWGLVGLRLVLPFSFKSVLSLLPSAETVPQDIAAMPLPQIHSGISALNSAVNPVLSQSMAPQIGDSVNPMQLVLTAAVWVWLAGAAAMFVYAVVSVLRIRRSIGESVPLRENILLCDRVGTPFIFGIFRPRICLPSSVGKEQADCIIAHEQAHLERCDHLIKPIGFTILAVYWFNPLMWLAYALLCRDIELACDERVVRDLDASERKHYAETLLRYSLPRRMITACPLAFGEVSVRQRIKRVLDYQKPTVWLVALSLLVCVTVGVCFLTDPLEKESSTPLLPLETVKTGYSAQQAAEDGCVVVDGNQTVANEKLWYDFYLDAQSGIPAAVYLYRMYTDQGSDYYVQRLEYDGNTYRLSFYDRYVTTGEEFLSQNEYRYLLRSVHSSYSSDVEPLEYYLLADDPSVTADGYFKFMSSSVLLPGINAYSHCIPIFYTPFSIDGLYGIAYGDVDGDGREEKCSLGMGRTSGVFSFTVTVTEENGRSCSESFVTEWYDLSFVRGADGKLHIRGVTQDVPAQTKYFELSLDKGQISIIKESDAE